MTVMLQEFLEFVKINTRSDESSQTIPTTAGQVQLARILEERLLALGLVKVRYEPANGYVLGCLPGEPAQLALGFIAHLDTADYHAENIQPQVIEGYDGGDVILNLKENIVMTVAEFPNLREYRGQTLITTNGLTLLGADDKAGIAEILGMLRYFVAHPEISHGDVWVAFGPDEEIGRGADRFVVADFPAAFAYTVDSGRVGHVEYETFNAAKLEIKIVGTSVHPGTAYGQMVNAVQLAKQIDNELPPQEVPEQTRGYQGFYLLSKLKGTISEAEMTYIIRDHDEDLFAQRKQLLLSIIDKLNASTDRPRITYELTDQYYNMRPVIDQCPLALELAKTAMANLGIKPIIEPFRGGTDGSKISLKGLPTPNLFTGGENFHGQYEFITLEAMEQARDTLIEIVKLAYEQPASK